jgi:hypothetical protein
MDRIVHAWFVEKIEPIELAASVRLALLEESDGRNVWIYSPSSPYACRPPSGLHPQLPKQKRINVRPILNLLGNRLALAVSGLAVNP